MDSSAKAGTLVEVEYFQRYDSRPDQGVGRTLQVTGLPELRIGHGKVSPAAALGVI
jgi:hypothetical protein